MGEAPYTSPVAIEGVVLLDPHFTRLGIRCLTSLIPLGGRLSTMHVPRVDKSLSTLFSELDLLLPAIDQVLRGAIWTSRGINRIGSVL